MHTPPHSLCVQLIRIVKVLSPIQYINFHYWVSEMHMRTTFVVRFLEYECHLWERCCLYAVSMASKKLIDACSEGDLRTARSIVQADPNTVTIKNADNYDKTPLHYACE